MFNENEELDGLKKDDHYHFSIPFEYITENLGNDEYETDNAYMDVDVDWSDSDHGYTVSYSVSDKDAVDTSKGNPDEDELYESIIYDELMEKLKAEGIEEEALVFGGL